MYTYLHVYIYIYIRTYIGNDTPSQKENGASTLSQPTFVTPQK